MIDLDAYSEANPQRFEMLAAACVTLARDNKPITIPTLTAALPPDFGVDDSDPWREIAKEAAHAVAHPAPNGGEMVAKETGDGATGVTNATPETASCETPPERKVRLDRRAAALRGELHQLTAERAKRRHEFGDALAEYLSGLPKISHEMNARNFITTSIAERKAGRGIPQAPIAGPSALDRHRMPYSPPDGSGLVHRTMRVGSNRGRATAAGPAVRSYPASYKSAKLPSDR
jgi:hypothetical protein